MATKSAKFASSVCRACLKEGPKNSVFSVHRRTNLAYYSIINACIPIQIKAEDNLSKEICDRCLNTIINFYIFRRKVIQNNLKLKQITSKANDIGSKLKSKDETKATPINPPNFEFVPVVCKPDSNLITEKENTAENECFDIKIDIKQEPLELQTSSDENKSQETLATENLNVSNYIDIEEAERITYPCNLCGKILKHQPSLDQHYKKHKERPYDCDICDKKFIRAAHLVVHRRTHTGEKPYRCKVCSKSFIQHAGLKTHMSVHTGEKAYICSICGKTFNHRSSLQYHKQVHVECKNELPYKCKVCEKSFKSSGYLRVHMRFHEGKRPFSCDRCDQKFFMKAHLNLHIKRHDNITSYKCIICGKGFMRSHHLKSHLTMHTGEKPFGCTLCPKKFAQSSHVNRHMKTHNKNLENVNA